MQNKQQYKQKKKQKQKTLQTEIKSGLRKTKLFTPLFPWKTGELTSATEWQCRGIVHNSRSMMMHCFSLSQLDEFSLIVLTE